MKRNIISENNCDFFVDSKAKLVIGNNVYFNKRMIISCKKNIEIGDNCIFGPDVKIYDNNHKFKKNGSVSACEYNCDDIIIEKNCWIGANCVILKGTHIGRNCVIGAGTVLSGNIPDNSIVSNTRNLDVREMR